MKISMLIFFYSCTFTKVYAAVDFNCIIPRLECPNRNITFWLYTRSNRNNPVEIKVTNLDSITQAPWVKGAPVKILIHGYTGHRDYSPNMEIRPAYMECCNYNIISVDYNNVALSPCYRQAAENTKLVGMCTAQLIDELVQKHGFPLNHFHVIGFSLGGHTAGFVGDYLKSGKLGRITALDPALPMFVTKELNEKIDSTDAHFVDVLHTNALVKGKLEPCGHVDFYANGGFSQPGCKTTKEQSRFSCDHARAPQYFAESITTEKGFYARNCYSWTIYMLGLCQSFYSDEEIIYGEYVSKKPIKKPLQNYITPVELFQKLHTCLKKWRAEILLDFATGSYFFNTTPKAPFALG